MGAVPRGLEWDRQPSYPIGLAQDVHAESLVLAVPFGYDNRDLVSGRRLTLGSGHTIHADSRGLSGRSAGSAAFASIPLNLSAYKKITVSWWMYWDSYANNDAMAMEFGAPTFASGGFFVDPNSGAPSAGQFQVAMGSTPVSSAGSFVRPSAATWHHYVLGLDRTQGAGAAITMFVDGEAQTYTHFGASSDITDSFANGTLYILSRSGTSLFGAGKIQNLVIRGQVLPSAESSVDEYRNPWQLFEPEQIKVPMATGGAAALAGGATSGATATGSLSTAIPILGAAVSGATASGSLSTAISLAGATATISATATGAMSATIRLAGDAVAAALAAGGLSTGIPLVGDGSGGGAGTGDLATGSGLAGSGAAGAAGTGVLTTQITLSGAAIAQAIASGALTTTPAGLAGDGASSSSGSGALSTGIPLAGAAAVSVVGAGGLVTAIALAGAATAAVSATGDLVVSLGLAGAALISAIGSGALLASITLNGAAVTGAVGAGALSGAALHASPWRTVTSLARVRSVRATARVRRCIAGVR